MSTSRPNPRSGGRLPVVPERVASLEPFVRARVLDTIDVHLAEAVARLGGFDDTDDADRPVLLAVAVASAALRRGHVCIELEAIAERVAPDDSDDEPAALDWPSADHWRAALTQHRAVRVVAPAATSTAADDTGPTPLVLERDRLYLQRVHRDETIVRDRLVSRARPVEGVADDEVDRAVAEVFADTEPSDSQRAACRVAVSSRLAVIAGGPGTGKTWTVARVLDAARRIDPGLDASRVALCAPTGKAAARMTESLHDALGTTGSDPGGFATAAASTVHSLVGMYPGRTPRFDAHNPLPHDLIVVDETSMLALSDMARLLEALRPDARLVLLGDPNQLTSVEAGTVLRDIVDSTRSVLGQGLVGVVGGATDAPLAGYIVELDRSHRFDAVIGSLADDIRTGDADGVIEALTAPDDTVRLVDPTDQAAVAAVTDVVVDSARSVLGHARAGAAAEAIAASLERKVLSATREGPMSRSDWQQRTERTLRDRGERIGHGDEWYAGRPVLVTVTDRVNDVFNGDTGVTVTDGDHLTVAFGRGDDIRTVPPSGLRACETWWAMTIHKSQGSEFDHVVVSLPTRPSPLLTRELLYTAVTRAKTSVTIVATPTRLREAIGHRVSRASGLHDRLARP